MSTTTLAQARARRNGIISEHYASVMFDIDVSTKALIDGEYGGKPIEVKSCQARITDLSRHGGTRKGRFLIQRLQYARLLKEDGSFIFIVLDSKGKVLLARLVSARNLENLFPVKESGTTQIPWNKIFPGALYE